MRRCRALVAAKLLKPYHTALLDALLWTFRPHTKDWAQVSYKALARNLHLRRAKLVEAIHDLQVAGLLTKQRTRVWVVSRGFHKKWQDANIYVFTRLAAPPSEFRRGSTREDVRKKEADKSYPQVWISPMIEGAIAKFAHTTGFKEPSDAYREKPA